MKRGHDSGVCLEIKNTNLPGDNNGLGRQYHLHVTNTTPPCISIAGLYSVENAQWAVTYNVKSS